MSGFWLVTDTVISYRLKLPTYYTPSAQADSCEEERGWGRVERHQAESAGLFLPGPMAPEQKLGGRTAGSAISPGRAQGRLDPVRTRVTPR